MRAATAPPPGPQVTDRSRSAGAAPRVGRGDKRGRGPPGWTVLRSYLVAAAALFLAALLDAEALEDTARSQPFGWRHDVATAVAEPLVDLSRALHLTAPRHWLEDTFDRPSTRPDPAPSPPATSPPTSVVPGTTTTGPSTTETTVADRRALSPNAPLRLVIAGDSMTESAGPALVDLSDQTGVVTAHHELRYSSGLTRPDYFDWPAMLTQLVADHDAEAVVVMFGANDAQGIMTAAGAADFGSEAWIAEYRARVAAVMELLTQDGRDVYWIGQPVMRSDSFDARMSLLTDIYRAESARHPGVHFIDVRALFADGEGSYSAYLPGSDGTPVLMRREDGIHFTEAGAQRLATAVMSRIDEDWRIREAQR